MYLLLDFEGFSGRREIMEKTNLDLVTIPCMFSYIVISDLTQLDSPCKKIKTKWFKVDKNISKRVKDVMISLVNKHKIDTIIYHGSYEKELFKAVGLKSKNIDLHNIMTKTISGEETSCEFKHNIKDGRAAHHLLSDYIVTNKISAKTRSELENYNKEDVAKLCTRFKFLIANDINSEAHKDRNRFIRLQNKI